jgi:hypothetical protein
MRSGGQDGQLPRLGRMRAARDGRVHKRHSVPLGHLRELVRLGRSHATHLQPDRAFGPIPEQGLNHIEDDARGGQHRDHHPGAADHLARRLGSLATTALEIAKMLWVSVPGDDRDAPIEQPMGHSRTHQAEAQQSDANPLLTCLVHLAARDSHTHARSRSHSPFRPLLRAGTTAGEPKEAVRKSFPSEGGEDQARECAACSPIQKRGAKADAARIVSRVIKV